MEQFGLERLVNVINVGAENRTDFFTPIKNAFDFWFQFYSDWFTMDTDVWELKSNRPGTLPEVNLSAPPIIKMDNIII